MLRFGNWLLTEERQYVDSSVLKSWETGFRDELEGLIQRTRDPKLRAEFSKMRDCPVRDNRGACRGFTDYIVGALIRNGVHRRCDLEDALSYVYDQMMRAVSYKGSPKSSLFGGFDETRPYNPGDNPLEARFKVSVGNAARAIAAGKIRRLNTVDWRPPGTLTIGGGRGKERGVVTPDEIPARGSADDHAASEMAGDIVALLRRKQVAHPDLPLVGLFQAMLAGQATRDQRARFGRRAAELGRPIILQAIGEYARATENWHLLRLLQKYQDFDATKPTKPRPQPKPKPTVTLSPDEKDYASIVALMDRFDKSANLAQLGHYRRRWLERKPRNPSSPYPNRMADVLANMVKDRVLERGETRKGGVVYKPGQNYDRYHHMAPMTTTAMA